MTVLAGLAAALTWIGMFLIYRLVMSIAPRADLDRPTWSCGRCGAGMPDGRYCGACGQAADWGDA